MKSSSKMPILQKLGVKPQNRIAILNSPKGYTNVLSKLPAGVSFATRLAGEPFDLVQGFYEDQKALKKDLLKLKKAIHPTGKIWVCWKKGNVTDLNRDTIWELGEKVGLDSVASCAVDEEWSAMKLMLPKSERIQKKTSKKTSSK